MFWGFLFLLLLHKHNSIKMKIREIHIQNYKIFNGFDIDFTHEGKPLDIIVVAGINGSGKSTLLQFIDRMVCGNKKLSSGNSKPEGKIIAEKFDKESGKLIQYNFAESLFSPYQSSIDIDDPSIVNDCLVKYFPSYSFEKKAFEYVFINYIDKLIYEEDKKSSEVYEIVRDRLNNIFEGFDLLVEFNLLDKKREIFFRNERSEKIPIEELSGGEKELITKAFSLYVSDIKNKVILIDEPESSLHPNWQNRILKIYEDFAKENNNQIIIATHSPHIIASTAKESLRLLVKKGDRIEVVSDFDGSYGYEVQKVLLEIMNLESLRIPGIDKKIESLYELVHSNQYNSDKFIKLQNEMETLLGRNDKDLMLMRLEIAKRNKMNQ